MATSSRRAVLTGFGIVTPLGADRAAVWQALREGRSGVRPITSFDASTLPTRIGGEIVGFDARNYVEKKERKSLKMMSRSIQLAVAAAQLALDDSRVDKKQLDPARFGVEFGAGLIASELEEMGVAARLSVNCQPGSVDLEKWGEQGLPAMPPLWMLKYLPNMLACHVSILHNAQGPNNTITENDVAGLLALGEAYHIVGRGHADFVLAGGADSKINPLSLVRHSLFMPLSRRNASPETACRPFDRTRDGIVPGEGAGVFALEEWEHARRRGARVYAEVVGFGSAFEAPAKSAGPAHRSGAGLARAIRAALAEAGVGPQEIDHINAQGFSSPESDVWEARALQQVFGECDPPVPVFAPKSYFGNLGAGSSTTELALSVLALEHGLLPPTLNYQEPDPACPVPVAAGSARPVTRPHVLKVGFTELGQCAAVVIRKLN
jgi:3-oxoacyl-[acyl-carrier-protein] synthase II